MTPLLRRAPAASLVLCCLLGACATKQAAPSAGLSGAARLDVAQAAEASGDDGLAETMLAKASAEAPGDAAVQLRYADLMVRRGHTQQARDLLLRHMSTVTDRAPLRAGLAAIQVVSGDASGAISEYDALLAASPSDMRLVVDKAVALDLLGRHAEAQALYHRALAASPDDPAIISDLALSLAMSGQVQEAASVAAPLRSADNVPPRIRNDIDVILAAGQPADTEASGRAAMAAGDSGSAVLQFAKALGQSGATPDRHDDP